MSNRPANVLSEEQKVALLGRPKLGENTRLQIRVKESKEFKVRKPSSRFLARHVGQRCCYMPWPKAKTKIKKTA